MSVFVPEESIWIDKLTQIETNDRVLGGLHGIANIHAKELGCRTLFLKKRVDDLGLNKVNQSDYDAAIKLLKEKDTDFATAIKKLQDKDKALDNTLTLLRASLTASVPVGDIRRGIAPTLYSNRFLFMRGDWILRGDFPQLFDFLHLKCGYPLDAQNRVQIPDARALVFRDQNLGKYSNVTEIGLGEYQEDALLGHQHLMTYDSGGNAQSANLGYKVVSGTIIGGVIRSGQTLSDGIYQVRQALENRVKAMGVHSQIFIGWDFNDQEAA